MKGCVRCVPAGRATDSCCGAVVLDHGVWLPAPAVEPAAGCRLPSFLPIMINELGGTALPAALAPEAAVCGALAGLGVRSDLLPEPPPVIRWSAGPPPTARGAETGPTLCAPRAG